MAIKTDIIAEYTAAAGVTVDGVLIKDGNVDGADVSALATASHAAVTLATDHGLSLTGQQLALGTPSTLNVSTANGVTTTTHAHAITSSSNPGAAASLLASNASGVLQLQGLIAPYVRPAADSTTALQLQNASGTSVLDVDTTNARVGIGTTSPRNILEIKSATDAEILLNRAGAWGAAPSGLRLAVNDANIDYWTFGMQPDATNNIYLSKNGANYVTFKDGGNVGIGTTEPASILHALKTSALTNAIQQLLTLGHDTSGTPAAGYGASIVCQLESSTTAAQNAARIAWLWQTATHASRAADLVLYASDYDGEREGLRVRATGTAPAIGFLGAAPSARLTHVADPTGGSTVDAEARTAINSILTTLETFGFHATS